VMGYLMHEQAILRVACETQAQINRLLGRKPPQRAFGAAEIDIHILLQGSQQRNLPDLVAELQDMLDARIVVDKDRIEVSERHTDAPN
jgi:hypothetical protein